MAITGGFGTTMDLANGTSRQWVMGSDGVKRWADTNEPISKPPEYADMERALKVIYTWAGIPGSLDARHVRELCAKALKMPHNAELNGA